MLVQIPELKGIQILQDTMGPSVVEMIDVFRLVQDSGKALLITHELSDEDVRYLKNTLSPAGLAIERMNQ
jgi:5-bromo-4-chloroindolyl phosphate hydrolysis protein